MRILQTIIQKLACVALLAGGAAIAVFSLSGLYQTVVAQLPQPNPVLRIAVGCVVAALAIFALLPLGSRRRRSRQLSFTGPNGPITVQLDSTAATLNKEVSKASIIKKAHIRLEPTKARDKANVIADISFVKQGDAGARETSEQIQVFIAEHAAKILGTDAVGEISLNIPSITTESATPSESLDTLAKTSATASSPAAQSSSEPVTADEALVPEPAPHPESEDLVTYEESVKAVEEEEQSLAGHVEDEPELAVAWDADEAIPEAESESSDQEDTSFDSLADEESPAADDEKPVSGP